MDLRKWLVLGIVAVGLTSAQSLAVVTFDFETEDDLVTPLVNGQDLSTPPEFGVIFNISGLGGLGPAIYDSTEPGPNSGGRDPDLQVNMGNLVIIQDTSNPLQTTPGIFDTPNDEVGGTIIFDFSPAPFPPGAVSIDLVDVNGGGMMTVTLTDTNNLTRTYDVPDEWTGAVDSPPEPGFGTLSLTTLAPQPPLPFAPGSASATATEDPGFDQTSLASISIAMSGSGAIDNLVLDLCVNAVCQAADLPCEGGEVCDENTGQCEAQPDAPSGTSCELDGDLCTAEVCDGNGACVADPGNDVMCAPADPPCEGGEVCNPATGICEAQPDAPSGTSCENDGDLCTAEVCDGNGSCVADPGNDVTCAPADPPCEGGEVCNPATGICEAQPDSPSGTSCENDGDLCTAEVCDGNGSCVADPGNDVTCAPADPPCEGGEVCNPATGICEAQPDAPSGTSCELDGDLCTAEVCDGNGACVADPGNDVTCAPADPPCEGGEVCNPATGICEAQPDAPSGTSCELDGDLCTAEECDGNGACVADPGNDVTCAPADPPCEGGEVCNPATGICEAQPDAPSGTSCENDGDLCTAEVCDGNGSCVADPGNDVTCAPADPPCEGGEVCNPATGICEAQPDAPSGTSCENDGDLCTAEICDGNGSCVADPGNDVMCAPADPPCEGGEVCNPATGICEAQPDAPLGTDCDLDGDLCTAEACDGSGACVADPGNDVMCAPADPPCDGGEVCNPATGLCDAQPDAMAGTNCENDGDLCTAELCDGNGACTSSPGDDVMCDPAVPPCEGGEVCNPSTGLCDAQPDAMAGTDCENDGDLCTAEVCDGSGSCVADPGSNVMCAPAVPPCEGGELCNPTTGLCEEQPDAMAGTDCENDGDLCTAELCDGNGACAASPGDDVMCAPAVPPCEGGELCNPATGLCDEQPDAMSGTDCENDGDLCTAELCDGNGTCAASPGDDVMCAPAVPPCEAGELCDPATGLCEELDDPGAATVCEADGNLCTNDRCDGMGGCETVSNVTCQAAAPPCEGGEFCEPSTGTCVSEPDASPGTACDADGDPCTMDVCDGFGDCMTVSETCGACCLTDGTCQDGLTAAQCVGASGLFNGIGSDCEGDSDDNGIDDACDTPPVPTMSDSAMLLLMGLLVFGLVMQVRRQTRVQ